MIYLYPSDLSAEGLDYKATDRRGLLNCPGPLHRNGKEDKLGGTLSRLQLNSSTRSSTSFITSGHKWGKLPPISSKMA